MERRAGPRGLSVQSRSDVVAMRGSMSYRCRRRHRCRARAVRESREKEDFVVVEIPAVWRRGNLRWSSQGQTKGEVSKGDASLSVLLRSLFLPSGYPESVRADFARWLPWHLASLLGRDILQVLSSQALLVAVSRSNATAASVVDSLGYSASLAAATQWVLKDAPGSFATLAVGSRGGQAFDADPKRWWVVTSAVEDAARLIEILLPLHPQLFLPGAALANCLRNGALVGRQSLVNGTVLRHFGRRENLGDIRAKLEAQGRILAILALPLGITLFRWTQELTIVSDHSGESLSLGGLSLAFVVYASLFGFHNLSCYKAAEALSFANLNANRVKLLAQQFCCGGAVTSPTEVALLEGVYSNRNEMSRVDLGIDFKTFLGKSHLKVHELIETYGGEGYLLTVSRKEEGIPRVLVCIKSQAEDADVIKAALNGEILAKMLEKEGEGSTLDMDALVREALCEATLSLDAFLSAVDNAGWSRDVVRGAWNLIQV